MGRWRIPLIVLLVLVLVIVAVPYLFFPGTYDVQRTVVVDAPPHMVKPYVMDLKKWRQWGQWDRMDSTMVYTNSDPSTGVGAWQEWTGKDGKGRMEITATTDSTVEYDLTFVDMGSTSKGVMTVKPAEAGGTEVIWRDYMDEPTNNLIFRWMIGTFIPEAIGAEFDKSLANLKELVETQPTVDVERQTWETGKPYLGVSGGMAISAMPDAFPALVGQAYGTLAAAGAQPAGQLMGLFHHWDEANDTAYVSAAIPVAGRVRNLPPSARLDTLPAGNYLYAKHVGGYNTMGTHQALDAYLTGHNLAFDTTRPAVEVYNFDPERDADSTTWETDIYYPYLAN